MDLDGLMGAGDHREVHAVAQGVHRGGRGAPGGGDGDDRVGVPAALGQVRVLLDLTENRGTRDFGNVAMLSRAPFGPPERGRRPGRTGPLRIRRSLPVTRPCRGAGTRADRAPARVLRRILSRAARRGTARRPL
ncbi:hypothetical protein GCM10018787_42730 [Streptomyces thermodiastaticus]|nr:hypothetical protein GCM10018787_42730 [Streptomyces thermodiastaticus]